MPNANRWTFERSSGYAGARCADCGEWHYINSLMCICDAPPTMPNKINQQTPGADLKIETRGNEIRLFVNNTTISVAGGSNQTPNARLLASAYQSFDKAGRELGIDASALAESIDLAELLRMVKVARYNPDARADMGPLTAEMVRLIAKIPSA